MIWIQMKRVNKKQKKKILSKQKEKRENSNGSDVNSIGSISLLWTEDICASYPCHCDVNCISPLNVKSKDESVQKVFR